MKMNRSHTVPLSKQALRVLQVMEPVSRHRPWVFPSIRKPLEHMHQQTANAALIRMGFGGELVAHGMRSMRSAIRRSPSVGKILTGVKVRGLDFAWASK